jgi:hypothetical protein
MNEQLASKRSRIFVGIIKFVTEITPKITIFSSQNKFKNALSLETVKLKIELIVSEVEFGLSGVSWISLVLLLVVLVMLEASITKMIAEIGVLG